MYVQVEKNVHTKINQTKIDESTDLETESNRGMCEEGYINVLLNINQANMKVNYLRNY